MTGFLIVVIELEAFNTFVTLFSKVMSIYFNLNLLDLKHLGLIYSKKIFKIFETNDILKVIGVTSSNIII